MYTNVYQRGNKLLVRGVEDGRRFNETVDFRPTVWMSSNMDDATDQWMTLDGQPVYAIQPGSMWDTKEFMDRYKDVHGMSIYESPGHVYQYITEQHPGEIRWSPSDVAVFTIDIETETENGFPDPRTAGERILLITIKDTRRAQITTFGLYPYHTDRKDVHYVHCGTEKELLGEFIHWWQRNCPDVITGWNSSFFDVTYLYNRLSLILNESLANKLSPWGIVKQRDIDYMGKSAQRTYIAGVSQMDYLELYRKFTYSAQESYKLDYIAFVELGERKRENPEATFREFYTKHWQLFVDYNIWDVELVDKIDAKMKLMDTAMTIAYDAKVNFEDAFGTVRVWDVILYNALNDERIVIPRRKDNNKMGHYEGAYVKDPLIGKHHWVMTFDLNSLYPHLMMQYNMSPETVTHTHLPITVDKLLNKEYDLSMLKESNFAIAANGWCFDRSKRGVLPAMMQRYYDRRVIYKKEMIAAKQQLEATGDKKWEMEISRLNNLQMAMKILLNSAYGACGNAYFRYFDMRIAEGITISGQLSIRWIANKLNEYMNSVLKTEGIDRVVLIDTDSVALSFDDLIQKVCPEKTTEAKIRYMDKIAEDVIQPLLDKWFQELADYMNAYEQKMQMKRENLTDVMISVSKKRYVMNVHNSEGVQYKEPKLKVMGLQMVKSSTPAVIRAKLRDSLHTILHGTQEDVQKYCADYRAVFNALSPEEIAFPRGINDLAKYANPTSIFVKGTPIHVRGALVYNHNIKKLGLQKKYQLIQDGDKIKFIYLKKPNPLGGDCIAFPDKLPEEFMLSSSVDYGKMFEKTFLDAVQNILDSLGWSTEPRATLEDWFS